MSRTEGNEWEDRVVLIIGGDSAGLAIAEVFRKQGAQVASILDPSKLIGPTEVSARVEAVLEQYGKIDVLVHAWELYVAASAMEMDLLQWKNVIHTNVKSKFLFAKEVGKHMLQREQGNIVLLSSIAGQVATPGAVAFAASQGAIHQITRTLGVEWAGRGLRVNAVASSLPEGLISSAQISRVTPMGRLPQVEELVGTVLYLASSDSQMVTGQIISVDGGYITQ